MPDCARVAASRGLPVVIVPHWDDPWPPMDSPAESQAVFSCFQFCLWWPSLVSPLLELPNSFHLVSQLFYHLNLSYIPCFSPFYPFPWIPIIFQHRPWGPWRQWPRPHLNAPPGVDLSGMHRHRQQCAHRWLISLCDRWSSCTGAPLEHLSISW